MVQDVGGVDEVGIEMVAPAEGAAGRGVHGELRRAGDGIAAGVAPLAGNGGSIGGRIQVKSRGSLIWIEPEIIGPDAAGDAGAVYRGEKSRGERAARAEGELRDE